MRVAYAEQEQNAVLVVPPPCGHPMCARPSIPVVIEEVVFNRADQN